MQTLHSSPRYEALEQKPREDPKLSQLLLPTQGLAPWGSREGTPQCRAELGEGRACRVTSAYAGHSLEAGRCFLCWDAFPLPQPSVPVLTAGPVPSPLPVSGVWQLTPHAHGCRDVALGLVGSHTPGHSSPLQRLNGLQESWTKLEMCPAQVELPLKQGGARRAPGDRAGLGSARCGHSLGCGGWDRVRTPLDLQSWDSKEKPLDCQQPPGPRTGLSRASRRVNSTAALQECNLTPAPRYHQCRTNSCRTHSPNPVRLERRTPPALNCSRGSAARAPTATGRRRERAPRAARPFIGRKGRRYTLVPPEEGSSERCVGALGVEEAAGGGRAPRSPSSARHCARKRPSRKA